MRGISNMDTFTSIATTLLAVVIAAVIVGMLMAFPIMWLWNDTLVYAVTWAKPISWTTAWGIWILSSVLFNHHTTTKSAS